jgi:hypothetical protein
MYCTTYIIGNGAVTKQTKSVDRTGPRLIMPVKAAFWSRHAVNKRVTWMYTWSAAAVISIIDALDLDILFQDRRRQWYWD